MVYSGDALDATFAALSDPTRRAILARLLTGERGISELAERFAMSLPAVSKHVRVLARAGLAHVERRGRVRHARLAPGSMQHAFDWLAHYRAFWEHELDLLTAYLEHPNTPETPWPLSLPQKRSPRSKSGASSARPARASSRRGRRPRN